MTQLTLAASAPTPELEAIPVIQTGQALMSLRDSGYSLPTALAEVVDNSIEAGAQKITVHLDEVETDGRKHVTRITIADDGEGMPIDILHRYLVIGYSTRWMRRDTIGKYGVGAKLAALNFGTRIDVWSRQSADNPWMHVKFDLLAAVEAEKVGDKAATMVSAPAPDPVPDDLADRLPEGGGTLVVWSDVDRLEQGRVAATTGELIVQVQKETARIFREFLSGGITIEVNDTSLLPHDPLYLMDGTRADQVLNKVNPPAEGQPPRHFAPQPILTREPVVVKAAGGAKAYLTVTLYPAEVTRQRGKGGDTLANQLGVPDNLGAISFVRLKREIAYTNVPRIFPTGVRDTDRFIGIEVAFDPELDDMFGVRNVKRGVEPHGELRDKIRELLKKAIPQARKLLDDRWGTEVKETKAHAGEHGPIMEAVADADKALPRSRATGTTPEEAEQERQALARDAGASTVEEERAYADRVRHLPFVIESVDFPGKMFVDIRHLDNQVFIRLNTRHRFYRELWKPMADLAENVEGTADEATTRAASRAVEALSLMIVAYGKAQSMDSDPNRYEDLTSYWGQFIDTLMGKVKGVI
jgi:hypothetical protein